MRGRRLLPLGLAAVFGWTAIACSGTNKLDQDVKAVMGEVYGECFRRLGPNWADWDGNLLVDAGFDYRNRIVTVTLKREIADTGKAFDPKFRIDRDARTARPANPDGSTFDSECVRRQATG